MVYCKYGGEAMNQPMTSKTGGVKWWWISLFSLWGISLVLWLLASSFHGFKFYDSIAGYPVLSYSLGTIPYLLLLTVLAMPAWAGITKIITPGFAQIKFWQFVGLLLLIGALLLLVLLALAWKIIIVPFLIIILGLLCIVFRLPVKTLLWGTVLGAFAIYGLFFAFLCANVWMDKSFNIGVTPKNIPADLEVPATVLGFVCLPDNDYLLIKPNSGEGLWAFPSNRGWREYLVGYRVDKPHNIISRIFDPCGCWDFLPRSQGGKGLPEIEVDYVHRGFFGIKWRR